MTDLESKTRRMSRNVMLTLTAASAMAFMNGCSTNDCNEGKDQYGQPCVEQRHSGGTRYIPQSYGDGVRSYHSTPQVQSTPQRWYSRIPSLSRGGFGSTGHGVSGGS